VTHCPGPARGTPRARVGVQRGEGNRLDDRRPGPWTARWGPYGGGCGCRHARERLGAFSPDNVTPKDGSDRASTLPRAVSRRRPSGETRLGCREAVSPVAVVAPFRGATTTTPAPSPLLPRCRYPRRCLPAGQTPPRPARRRHEATPPTRQGKQVGKATPTRPPAVAWCRADGDTCDLRQQGQGDRGRQRGRPPAGRGRRVARRHAGDTDPARSEAARGGS
jgi:hypothetical protein